MISFENKVVIITGASRGIGQACAMRLGSLGATVVVNFLRSSEAAAETASAVQRAGGQAIAVRADVSQKDDLEALVEYTFERFGRIDVVVSNAAAGGFKPILEVSPASLQTVMAHNAAPLLWLAQAVAKRPQASVVKFIALSSHGGQRAVPNYGVIGVSKAALEALTRQLAYELGPRGMNFNTVLSGMVNTQAVQAMPDTADVLKAAQESMLVKRRELLPDDIAQVVAFLASPSSDMIQGQIIVVDGGSWIRI